MDLEAVVLALGIAGFVITVWVWLWLRGIQRQLIGRDGYELVRILAWIVGWSIVARVVSTCGLFLFNLDRSNTDLTLIFSIVAQVLGAGIFIGAALRVRRLSKAPLDGSGETVVDLHAQPAGQVPDATGDVGAAVDHGNGRS